MFGFSTDKRATTDMLVPGLGMVRYINSSLVAFTTVILTLGSWMLNTVSDITMAITDRISMHVVKRQPYLTHFVRRIWFRFAAASSSSLQEPSAIRGRGPSCSSPMATSLDQLGRGTIGGGRCRGPSEIDSFSGNVRCREAFLAIHCRCTYILLKIKTLLYNCE